MLILHYTRGKRNQGKTGNIKLSKSIKKKRMITVAMLVKSTENVIWKERNKQTKQILLVYAYRTGIHIILCEIIKLRIQIQI